MNASSARFVGTLSVSPYPDGKTWYLNRSIVFKSAIAGDVRVPRGFETDFASVPAIVTNLFPRWSTYGPASVIHDWLYWNQHVAREVSDQVFLEAMVVSQVEHWKRFVLFRAVRWFGGWAWCDNELIAQQGFSRVRTLASPNVPAWSRER